MASVQPSQAAYDVAYRQYEGTKREHEGLVDELSSAQGALRNLPSSASPEDRVRAQARVEELTARVGRKAIELTGAQKAAIFAKPGLWAAGNRLFINIGESLKDILMAGYSESKVIAPGYRDALRKTAQLGKAFIAVNHLLNQFNSTKDVTSQHAVHTFNTGFVELAMFENLTRLPTHLYEVVSGNSKKVFDPLVDSFTVSFEKATSLALDVLGFVHTSSAQLGLYSSKYLSNIVLSVPVIGPKLYDVGSKKIVSALIFSRSLSNLHKELYKDQADKALVVADLGKATASALEMAKGTKVAAYIPYAAKLEAIAGVVGYGSALFVKKVAV